MSLNPISRDSNAAHLGLAHPPLQARFCRYRLLSWPPCPASTSTVPLTLAASRGGRCHPCSAVIPGRSLFTRVSGAPLGGYRHTEPPNRPEWAVLPCGVCSYYILCLRLHIVALLNVQPSPRNGKLTPAWVIDACLAPVALVLAAVVAPAGALGCPLT